MRFMADDREHERGSECGDARGHFLRFVFGTECEGLAKGGEWDDRAEAFGGFASADERAVPDFGGGERPVALEKRGEPTALVDALRTEGTERVLLFGDGVGVAHEIDDGHEKITCDGASRRFQFFGCDFAESSVARVTGDGIPKRRHQSRARG